MSTQPAARPARDDDVLAALRPVRRVVTALLGDPAAGGPDVVDDVVQEVAARLLEVRWRLDQRALEAYAVVVARHLAVDATRERTLLARHAHRLVAPPVAADAAEPVVLREEHEALRRALDALPDADRILLVEHEVRGVPSGKLAADLGTSPGALAARLARARARLRVRHLLALRRVELPSPACRGVLEALSLGDRRRQVDLRTGEHLLACPVCPTLAPALVERSRTLTALAPVGAVLAAWDWVVRSARAHPLASGATAALVLAGLVVLLRPDAAPAPSAASAVPPTPAAASPSVPRPPGPAPSTAAPAAQRSASLVVPGARLLPAAGAVRLRGHAGLGATGTRLAVLDVPADEGFWAGTSREDVVWVQLVTDGESAATVRPGDRVSFTGRVEAVHDATPSALRARLGATGAYVLVAEGRLRRVP